MRVHVGCKSSYSNGGANDCVEVNRAPVGHVGVRDSKLTGASPVLAIPAILPGIDPGVVRGTGHGEGP